MHIVKTDYIKMTLQLQKQIQKKKGLIEDFFFFTKKRTDILQVESKDTGQPFISERTGTNLKASASNGLMGLSFKPCSEHGCYLKNCHV